MSQGVKFNRLMLEMHSIQMETMTRAKPAQAPTEVGTPNFSETLSQAVDKVNETQQAFTAMANAFEVGQNDVNLVNVTIASQKTSVSFRAMTQVRNKLVQAYQNTIQMSV